LPIENITVAGGRITLNPLSVLLYHRLAPSLQLESLTGQNKKLFFFNMAQEPPGGQASLIIEASRSHSDTPQSVGLLWTSDQQHADASTIQHETLTRERNHIPSRIRIHNPTKRPTAERHLRPRGQWIHCLLTAHTETTKTVYKSVAE